MGEDHGDDRVVALVLAEERRGRAGALHAGDDDFVIRVRRKRGHPGDAQDQPFDAAENVGRRPGDPPGDQDGVGAAVGRQADQATEISRPLDQPQEVAVIEGQDQRSSRPPLDQALHPNMLAGHP